VDGTIDANYDEVCMDKGDTVPCFGMADGLAQGPSDPSNLILIKRLMQFCHHDGIVVCRYACGQQEDREVPSVNLYNTMRRNKVCLGRVGLMNRRDL
jgi:hypothetical protein